MKGFEPSLLDKLFDDEPHAPLPSALRQLSLEELKATVARDIESLLNTRIVHEDADFNGLPECRRSLLTYGLNDFAGLSLASFDDRQYICQSLRNAIERHEPRLQNVNVALSVNERATSVLCFGISAVLLVGPAREPVSFDAMLQPSTLQYSVTRGRG
ncbi:type VI secretion system baseplate subunit TssE [Cupriavidus taiwanensis]|uniref:IraD/Gp25-like domain-containing protein n=6 Tax=Cupriavidus TaxID=106589 RepID=A0A375CNN7_9BURK|nr:MULTISPECIES: type VI secretion system baseplate subunit TssE [Cupriavidus]AMR81457.1 type VI secretion protein [Cupriavidus nantongensis]MBB2917180.1 type VI secretion system protein ImpF [Cupriavidus alkaliphilus]MBB3009158.1 type VI secretion system protein ImpF [Cupriavidus alkaliphilus]MCO4862507.1 type VI secretion system baseplate subunit TssE [Cupriavidus sp. WGlv3]MDK3022107.1 type VI secretion system baseplate subunit TssE [Cupriavidus taiwanensis]